MIWKPKEKELTLEEAVALAKKELAPFWFGIGPQIAGVKANGKYAVYPLNTEFSKKSWLIMVVDPTDFFGEAGVLFAKEWFRRYGDLGLDILVVFTAPYSFLKVAENAQKYVERLDAEFMVAVDVEQAVAPALGAAQPPRVLLLHEGETHLNSGGVDWLKDAEISIQSYLRKTDPGLPLLTVFQPKIKTITKTARVEFGFEGETAAFPEPGFQLDKDGKRVGDFPAPKAGQEVPIDSKENNEKFSISLVGKWTQDKERIVTSDPNASLTFRSPFERVAFIAQSLSRTTDHPLVSLEIGGLAIYEAIAGEHISFQDDGKTVARVYKPELYHVLNGLPKTKRDITFKFEVSSDCPVALYGFRFGE